MIGYIFKCVLPDGKIYIGKKTADHIVEGYYGTGSKQYRQYLKTIEKASIQRDILAQCDTQDELSTKELYYINLFDATNPNIGWNKLRHSGIGHNRPFSDSAKMKLSHTNKISNAGKTWYTNGVEEHFWREDEVRDGYLRGRLVSHIDNFAGFNYGMHHYTDGEININSFECPDGFYQGITISDTALNNIKKSHSTDSYKEKMSKLSKGRTLYHLGDELRYFHDGDTIPDGFMKGAPESYKEKRRHKYK